MTLARNGKSKEAQPVLCYGVRRMGREIRIIGGGLAGLTLGLLLRRANVPVEIWDAGTYPRHRVCGEFISGRGLAALLNLQLPGVPEPLGLFSRTVQFYDGAKASLQFDLPEPALSIDRSRLDHLLANEFKRVGGILRENSRWTDSFETEGLIRATGRRLKNGENPSWVGIKAHATNCQLSADLEMHFSDSGYVGISRQKDGVVNICGLFKSPARLRKIRSRSAPELREVFCEEMGYQLAARLRDAEFDSGTFSAIAGLSLKRMRSADSNECRIGDSICMIPPFTGNGMSIAIESAHIAATLLQPYVNGAKPWHETVQHISSENDALFQQRLKFAGLLQNLAGSRFFRLAFMTFLKPLPGALVNCYRFTR